MNVFHGAWTLAFLPVLLISLWALFGPDHSKQLRYAALPAVIISAAGCWYGRPATWGQDIWNSVSGSFEYVFVENIWAVIWTVGIAYTFLFALWYLLRGRRDTTPTATPSRSKIRRFGSWAAKALPWT